MNLGYSEPLIWFLILWFWDMIRLSFSQAIAMFPFEWTLIWFWDKPLLYDLLHDFETWLLVWYPSHLCFPTYGGTIGMSVMHHWHDSCVGEWFLTPSLFMITIMAIMTLSIWLWDWLWVRGVWVAILDLFCLVDLTMTLSWLWGDWYCVLYMPFTISGSSLLHPFEEWGHPSYYLIIWEDSPLYDYEELWYWRLIWYDMFLGSW